MECAENGGEPLRAAEQEGQCTSHDAPNKYFSAVLRASFIALSTARTITASRTKRHAIVSPPDTLIVCPVMYPASSDSRNAIIPA